MDPDFVAFVAAGRRAWRRIYQDALVQRVPGLGVSGRASGFKWNIGKLHHFIWRYQIQYGHMPPASVIEDKVFQIMAAEWLDDAKTGIALTAPKCPEMFWRELDGELGNTGLLRETKGS